MRSRRWTDIGLAREVETEIARAGVRRIVSSPGEKGTHPRGDRKSAEAIENIGDSGAPLRKRVRNCMNLLCLHGCNKKQRSWRFEMEWTRRAKHTLGICNDEKRKELLEDGFVSGWKERLCKSMVRGGRRNSDEWATKRKQ